MDLKLSKNMNIIYALQTPGIRVVYEDKWLVYDTNGTWRVYQRKFGMKNTVILCEAEKIEDALQFLITPEE